MRVLIILTIWKFVITPADKTRHSAHQYIHPCKETGSHDITINTYLMGK